MKKLDAYRGRLSAAQLAEGMNAAAQNATRLAGDATSLLELGRFATAASLATLAIEEAGKVSILRELALATTDKAVTAAWKSYRSHTRKNVSWILPQLVSSGARSLEEMRPLFDCDSDHPYLLDQLKQLGFYTDCLGKAHWSIPSEVIDKSLARMLVGVASVLCRDVNHSEREVELWVQHMGPVWGRDIAWMKQALINWHEALVVAGLTTVESGSMENFVRGDQSGTED